MKVGELRRLRLNFLKVYTIFQETQKYSRSKANRELIVKWNIKKEYYQ